MAKGKKEAESKIRQTIFVYPSLVKKLDYIYKQEGIRKNENLSRTDIINEGLADYILKYEKKNGAIPVK